MTTKTKQTARAEHFMPAEVHATADRLREARALLAQAEANAAELWTAYQHELRMNTKDPETPRTRWEGAQADRESRRMAVSLLESDLAAALRNLAADAHRPGSAFRAVQELDSRAALAAETARRELVAEAVGLLQRAARTGTEEAACPRTGAALAEFAALAGLVPDVAEEVTTRARVPRHVSAGCVPVVEEALSRLRNVAAPIN